MPVIGSIHSRKVNTSCIMGNETHVICACCVNLWVSEILFCSNEIPKVKKWFDPCNTFTYKDIWQVSIQISLLYLSRLNAIASMHTYDAATGIFSITLK